MRARLRTIVVLSLLVGSAATQEAVLATIGPLTEPSLPTRHVEDPVAVDGGLVRGERLPIEASGRNLRVFRGIPYAAPPIADLRWREPRPVAPWRGVRACTAFGHACPQPHSRLMGEVGEQDEDCLYLNIWAPDAQPGEKLPVMVWIHGGAFVCGSGAVDFFAGDRLARRGAIVVTVNYRLGPFGFLAHPLLSQESPQGVSGDYGLLDQIAALKWVRANIARFGGNPDCVTLFGESAGSASVCLLMTSPLAKGLFQRAIAESGAPHGNTVRLRERRGRHESAEAIGERLVHQLGCDGAGNPLAALRAKSAAEIMAVAKPSLGLFGHGTRFQPVVDGWALPEDPEVVWAEGRQLGVPFIAGTNADEGTLFLRYIPIAEPVIYRLSLKELFGNGARDILTLYNAHEDAEVPLQISSLITDSIFVMPTRALMQDMTRTGAKAWMYHFTRVSPRLRAAGLGATHTAEIPYVFEHVDGDGYDAADRTLSQTMSAAWIRFAVTGDPNGGGLPAWPAYDAKDRYCDFGDRVVVAAGLHRAGCDLFERLWKAREATGVDPTNP